ncbi:hypothetical protein L249_8824 [Ophiocordyceps polyrhachis-furcata BCC 54312]|uniref:Uncharacterized protein n=1 Tax=Ophiocordyceps polyrhachis-furcata BCC 54312 TaxID=1330021 RepID=A0A367L255_9HYPO|nr:hypothetical protein L249_8824 [Ophiocordyceps polyrhachis-furcata BCC 54312]
MRAAFPFTHRTYRMHVLLATHPPIPGKSQNGLWPVPAAVVRAGKRCAWLDFPFAPPVFAWTGRSCVKFPLIGMKQARVFVLPIRKDTCVSPNGNRFKEQADEKATQRRQTLKDEYETWA